MASKKNKRKPNNSVKVAWDIETSSTSSKELTIYLSVKDKSWNIFPRQNLGIGRFSLLLLFNGN